MKDRGRIQFQLHPRLVARSHLGTSLNIHIGQKKYRQKRSNKKVLKLLPPYNSVILFLISGCFTLRFFFCLHIRNSAGCPFKTDRVGGIENAWMLGCWDADQSMELEVVAALTGGPELPCGGHQAGAGVHLRRKKGEGGGWLILWRPDNNGRKLFGYTLNLSNLSL